MSAGSAYLPNADRQTRATCMLSLGAARLRALARPLQRAQPHRLVTPDLWGARGVVARVPARAKTPSSCSSSRCAVP
eukprot:2046738-Prymnesium_polylepis.1